MKKEDYLFDGYINMFPQNVGLLYGDKEFVRNLWYDRIKEYYNCLSVLSELIRHNLLLEEEFSEAMEQVIKYSKRDIITEDNLWFLNQYGFSKVFEDIVFHEYTPLVDDFDWANNNIQWVINYLEIIGISRKACICLNSVFADSKPYPYKAQAKLKQFFSEQDKLRANYIAICKEVGISPTNLLIV